MLSICACPSPRRTPEPQIGVSGERPEPYLAEHPEKLTEWSRLFYGESAEIPQDACVAGIRSVLWVGSVTGGIWKSLDGGRSWSAMDDFMANLTISSMIMDPGDPDTLYAGTGERTNGFRGGGLFKSVDGGARGYT